MAGVIENDFRFGIITAIGFGTGRQKERIVLSPNGKSGGLPGAEKFLELWVEGDIAAIVQNQVELHFVRARSRHVGNIQRIAVGRNRLRVGSVKVLDVANDFRAQCVAAGFTVFGRGISPISLPGFPGGAEAFDVSIAVLRDECGNSFRKAKRKTKAHRRAVIKNVNRKFLQADLLDEISDNLGHGIEGVAKTFSAGYPGKPKAGKIRRDNVEIAREFGN